MGPKSGLRLQVLNDDLTTPSGKSSVRVIQASLKEQTVKFTCGGQDIVPKATFASVSSYQAIPANTWTMKAIGSNSTATDRFNMAAGTVHTMVVLDGASGLEIVNLEDAAGAGQPPAGGGTTRLGGNSRRRAGSPPASAVPRGTVRDHRRRGWRSSGPARWSPSAAASGCAVTACVVRPIPGSRDAASQAGRR